LRRTFEELQRKREEAKKECVKMLKMLLILLMPMLIFALSGLVVSAVKVLIVFYNSGMWVLLGISVFYVLFALALLIGVPLVLIRLFIKVGIIKIKKLP